jgi:hypothetical protein
MSLSKNERRLTIWIGIAIGIACSSMLVRYALKQKNIRAEQRSGNYASGLTASDLKQCPPLPEKVRKDIPNGIVVFHDYNQSISEPATSSSSWVIETTGKFRSERLFILVEHIPTSSRPISYYRASEIYALLHTNQSRDDLDLFLNQETNKIIGRNSQTLEHIVQIKNMHPREIRKTLKNFSQNKALIKSARLPTWRP